VCQVVSADVPIVTRQVGQYVRYNNMTELWTCVVPMDSQNTSQFDPETQFPACEHFQYVTTNDTRQSYLFLFILLSKLSKIRVDR
jgi:hypothetical protein